MAASDFKKCRKCFSKLLFMLTLSWWSLLLYRNQCIDLLCKLVDWFLYGRDLRRERIKSLFCRLLSATIRFLNIVIHLKLFKKVYLSIWSLNPIKSTRDFREGYRENKCLNRTELQQPEIGYLAKRRYSFTKSDWLC